MDISGWSEHCAAVSDIEATHALACERRKDVRAIQK